jgi:restriction system protein
VSKPDDFFDRALIGLVTRVPAWTVAAIALLLYVGGGLVLPLALRWSTLLLVEANVIGTSLAALIGLGWLVVQMEARDRRHLLEWTSNLRLLTAEEFEWLVGELFRREGWKVQETGRQDGPYGNIDLELTHGASRMIVQCKRWQSWLVGVDDIRGFAGTLLREGVRGSSGFFVTLSDFSQQARTEAEMTGITLIDGGDLHSRVERARRPEPCPICQAAMILSRSSRGWWFRCNAVGCQGKRDLGNDQGRAVELLTQPQ